MSFAYSNLSLLLDIRPVLVRASPARTVVPMSAIGALASPSPAVRSRPAAPHPPPLPLRTCFFPCGSPAALPAHLWAADPAAASVLPAGLRSRACNDFPSILSGRGSGHSRCSLCHPAWCSQHPYGRECNCLSLKPAGNLWGSLAACY